jgi:hypothetical protein
MSTSRGGSASVARRNEASAGTIRVGSAPLLIADHRAAGGLVEIDGESHYCIDHYDALPPFFMSVVSAADHWLFISSNGALSAGRRSPDHPLFPYYTVDKIHDSRDITGSRTLILATSLGGSDGSGANAGAGASLWEPFSDRYAHLYRLRRRLYKNRPGNVIRFEEANEDLGLSFSLTWTTSEKYGFVKRAMLRNHGNVPCAVRILDGLQNIMPYGVPRAMQTERSVLVDAYRKNELVAGPGIGIMALSARPVDRPEPSEALKATTVWSVGLPADAVLLSTRQLECFRRGARMETEALVRGERGAYFVHAGTVLAPDDRRDWLMVAEIEQDAADVAALAEALSRPAELVAAVGEDVRAGSRRLRSIIASSDGLQETGDEMTTARHHMNVLFNVMRGGVFADGYHVQRDDLRAFIQSANRMVAVENAAFIEDLPARATIHEVLARARSSGPQGERICYEYLPLIFSRRHGDPSRPWNHFTIDLRAEDGTARKGYEGNWRDIFQNWEALARSFPEFLESMIARFVNASTADGYNPYRISSEGIDWEVPDPGDPWSFIGYWGDHQIVYLLALLELSRDHHPARLPDLLARRIFAYANVPYRIRPYADLLRDPHDTIDFDAAADRTIRKRVEDIGADGKLHWLGNEVVLVTLAEKLIVPLLAKLTNFIPGGGIWMNTQRPEWNDANNALVGHGVSLVTLCHLRRYLSCLDDLFSRAPGPGAILSAGVADLVDEVSDALTRFEEIADGVKAAEHRREFVDTIGEAGSRYRTRVYKEGLAGEGRTVAFADLRRMFVPALSLVDRTIEMNRREDGLYHSYNLLSVGAADMAIDRLDLMLEGQAAVLTSGILSPQQSIDLLAALRASPLYRADQHSYLLYPDRQLPNFVEKNNIAHSAVRDSRLLQRLLAEGDRTLVTRDVNGTCHFNGTFCNRHDVTAALDVLERTGYSALVQEDRELVLGTFEDVFRHRSYTGRSGTFFGYEGLGCIYWHMVSKLALAVQTTIFNARDAGAGEQEVRRLVDAYHDIRGGLGVNKTPEEYGAFPTDPYSHTPGHGGAKQPGMTGQVKEDILCRWGELGVRVMEGRIVIDPILLRASEFVSGARSFEYIGVDDELHTIDLVSGSLAFTCCQVPFIYRRSTTASIVVVHCDGSIASLAGNTMDRDTSAEIFKRSGIVHRVEVELSPGL